MKTTIGSIDLPCNITSSFQSEDPRLEQSIIHAILRICSLDPQSKAKLIEHDHEAVSNQRHT